MFSRMEINRAFDIPEDDDLVLMSNNDQFKS